MTTRMRYSIQLNAVMAAVGMTVGCGATKPRPLDFVAVKPEGIARVPTSADVTDSSEHGSTLKALVDTTAGVIGTVEFRTFVASIADIAPSRSGRPMTGARVDRVYAGRDDAFPRLPLLYAIGTHRSQTAGTGRSNACSDGGPGRCRATITIGEATIRRASRLLDEPTTAHATIACAVNTLAHEWTHAFTAAAVPSGYLFTDDGHKRSRSPLVSYTIGAAAQCVYLKLHNYGAIDLAKCVQAVGTNVFNNTCTEEWAAKMIRL
jgi:hypothetical protein